MRKTLILTIALSLLVSVAAFGQDFWDPPTLDQRNASQFFYYMLEVPDGAVMTSDTDAADWAWFDPEYVITMEEWREEADRELPDRDDLDITTMLAWKGAPVNRWYVHMTAHDDTLQHDGITVNRWGGDMLGFAMDPQDHGRDRGNGGYSMEFVTAPGDINTNYAERYPESDGSPGQAAWLEMGEPPWLNGAVVVDPPEAWAADLWTSDTGGETVYEWDIAVFDFLEDGGPAASTPRDLDAMSGEDGFGLPIVFWYEDGEGGKLDVDMTIRGPEASARQYFAATKLLTVDEYECQGCTAVESRTWGRIKSSF